MFPEFAVGILGAVVVGLLAWTGRSLVEVTRTLAVHGEKHEGHARRLDRLESRPTF